MTETLTELVGPTVNRLARAGSREIVPPVVSQQVTRRAWRIKPIVESMHDAGKIDDRRWEAYERLERDIRRAALDGPRIIALYGERAGGGGTPTHQLDADAFDRHDCRDMQRESARGRVATVMRDLTEEQRMALVSAVTTECTLEQIGIRCSRFANLKKAEAVAGARIEDALWLVYTAYQRLYGQSLPTP